jgi:saxitoxin biosynthesis operon SxtJ-like protein
MITPDWRPDDRRLRQFAVISLFGFGAMALVAWRAHGAVALPIALASLGVLVCLAGLARPASVRPVYLGLMAVTLPIGWVVSGVLLRAVFYGVITPVGLVFRAVGRDALRLRRPDGESYWTDHDAPDDPAGYFRQS